jgi:hypothetical protein
MRGLDHSWVPLHFAIGWVLTRDRTFVADLPFDGSTRKLAVAIAIAKFNGTKADAIRNGWMTLRDAMLTGKVRAQGTPYRRRNQIGGVSVETAERRRKIPTSDIETANLQDDNKYPDCLITEDWHVQNVPFYRKVRVLRADLLAVFRPPASTVKDEAGARRVLADLLREQPKLRRADARQHLVTEGFKVSGQGFLHRVWPHARVDAGLDALAPSGRPAGEDGSS